MLRLKLPSSIEPALMLLIFTSYFYSCSCNNGSRDKGAKKVDKATAGTERAIEKSNFNVFIENSASMDGYVKGVTEFETATYNLLGDIKISGLCDSLNLNYINNKIPFSKKNALSSDIEDFIEKLEPSSFKQKGGDRTTSDLKNILRTVLRTVDDKNVAILISDFVFSPGKNNDATDYLNNQTVGIKIDFAEKIKSFDLAVAVVQLQSNFIGDYYDKMNIPISINCKRPYYIWIIGSKSHIRSIINKRILDNIKGGYKNRLVFYKLDNPKHLNYSISKHPLNGSYDVSGPSNKNIVNAEMSSRKFGFSLLLNYSDSLQDLDYYLDKSIYELSNGKYDFSVSTVENITDKEFGYTHKMNLITTELKSEQLVINAKMAVPNWVANATSSDDSRIKDDAKEEARTFGFSYLIDGVFSAYYSPSNYNNIIYSTEISIKR